MSLRILPRFCSNLTRSLVKENSANVNQVRFGSSYKAAVIDSKEKDKPFKINEVKSGKKLKKGQVRIKVRSCCFNVWDYALASGQRTSDIQTPGYEISGEVMETTDTHEVAKGDKVIAFNKGTMGGFAQQIIVDEKDVWLKPNTIGSQEACGLIEGYGSAVLGLVKSNHLTEKQNIVITLAAGHGLAPLDIAANVYKAKVLAVCEHEGEESAVLRERGAWSALAYTDKGVKSAVKDLTKGAGIPLAYSTMSGPPLLTLLSCMAHNGHVMYSGPDDIPAITASSLLTLPSFKLSPISLWATRTHSFDAYREAVSDALEMCEQNLVSPSIVAKFKLEEINKAFELFKDKRPMGKVIITMD